MHAVKDGVLFEMRVNIYKTLAHTQKKMQNAFHIKCRQSPWHKRKLKNQLNAETNVMVAAILINLIFFLKASVMSRR